jgi:putative ABC transport system substrate-binding protein
LVEGQNLVIEYPDAFGREERLPVLAADLARKQVDLILVIGPAPLAAARKATTTIPLVMVASSSDPVAEGVAVRLARPGGNVTGLTYANPNDSRSSLSCSNLRSPESLASRYSGISTLRSFTGTGRCR